MPETTITIRDNGPLRITGPFTLVDADGNEFEIATEITALCRCGQSARKPFCDASHRTCGFASAPRAES
jgi:CDGSH-type Zn-finger protein